MAPSSVVPFTTQCVQYEASDGYITSFVLNNALYGKAKIFRKISRCPTEIEICKILKEHPHPNCVMIYDVNGFCIDMEFLKTTFYETNNKKSILRDMRSALDHLNGLGVVYVDLKLDNIGCERRTYKLFDFDMSGIVKTSHQWYMEPTSGYVYRDYYKHVPKEDNKTLFDIDEYAFIKFEKALF